MDPTSAPPGDGRRRAIEAFLLARGPAPAAADLRATGLASYAFATLPAGAPERADLLADVAAASALHLRAKADLQPLLRAWNDAGIETVLFKGFHLAEFVYPTPAARPYSDIDLLMRPEDAAEASRLAQALGWSETWRAGRDATLHDYRPSVSPLHEVMHLQNPGATTRLDVHRRILHNFLPLTRRQRRITEAAWEAARTRDWEGVRLLELDGRDALLIGLVLNRCWSGDHWRLKPSDYLDARLLAAAGVDEDRLRARAAELGCGRTLERFLRRCDPYRRVLDLQPPTFWQRQRDTLATLGERGHPGFEAWLWTVSHLPGTAVDVVREAPGLMRTLGLLRRYGPHGAGERLAAGPPAGDGRVLGYWQWRRLQRGIRWGLRLLRREREGDCPERTLALYAALRRLGVSARLRPGPTPTGEAVRWWLEVDGRRLRE